MVIAKLGQFDGYQMQVIEKHPVGMHVIADAVAVNHTVVGLHTGHYEIHYAYHINGVELVFPLSRADLLADGEAGVIDHPIGEVSLLGVLHLNDERFAALSGAVDIEHRPALLAVVGNLLLLTQFHLSDVLLRQDGINQVQQQVLVAGCVAKLYGSSFTQPPARRETPRRTVASISK